MPETVSIVTGNHTARATRPIAEIFPDGDSTIASGTHAVAGIGPTTFNIGMPQYRATGNQPMPMPVTIPTTTPTTYPHTSRINECQVQSTSILQSSSKAWSTPAGLGKYGSGSNRSPVVMISHPQNNRIAAAKIGLLSFSQ